eukprot:TRINITY_DN24024_c0_g2_i1.p1 TRINITY_DN24024_c0_g2~~TRINITY_DN24024_c0_g2_i1.p1  ORF type:complete len:471 (-),score=48.36 TRINITY_DN24024_c0_g2_i1:146-1558(-)
MSDRIQVLLTWLKEEHNVDLSAIGVEVRVSPAGGIGLFATRPLTPGAVLARIPTSAILHAGKARASKFGQALESALASSKVVLLPEELLWLYMVWGRDKANECPWYPYLQSLPDQSPLEWQQDEMAMQLLQGTPVYEDARLELESQRRRYDDVIEALTTQRDTVCSSSSFTFDAWMWARACYHSRAFSHGAFPHTCVDGRCISDFLCPVLDILNHVHIAEVVPQHSEEFAALALPSDAVGFDIGDEIYNLYGRCLNNGKLLTRYGFTLADNPYDSVEEIVFQVKAAKAQERVKLLMGSDVTGVEAELTGSPNELYGTQKVCVRLDDGLNTDLVETPASLLRVSSMLSRGLDYDQDEASCTDKYKVCKFLATALFRMASCRTALSAHQRGTNKQPANLIRRLRLRLTRSITKRRMKERARGKCSNLHTCTEGARMAHVYFSKRQQIMRSVFRVVNEEGDMAKLAAQMEDGE